MTHLGWVHSTNLSAVLAILLACLSTRTQADDIDGQHRDERQSFFDVTVHG